MSQQNDASFEKPSVTFTALVQVWLLQRRMNVTFFLRAGQMAPRLWRSVLVATFQEAPSSVGESSPNTHSIWLSQSLLSHLKKFW